MSKPWRITRGEQQFTVKDVAELKLSAIQGRILASDLVQEPEGSEWRYAFEVSHLKGVVKAAANEDIEYRPGKAGTLRLVRALLVLALLAVAAGGLGALYTIYTGAPDPSSGRLFGEGPQALGPLDAMATESANLLSGPDSKSSSVGSMPKDARVQLVRKMGGFYEVRLEDGKTGWVGTGQVVPGYLFKQELADKYDPLFNPDAYLRLTNYAWTPRGDPKQPDTLTDLMFEILNPTDYGMSGIILKITFFDGNDQKMDTKDFEVPRLLGPGESLFLDGIEVDIAWDENSRATVDIYGARALLPAEYSKLKAEEQERLRAEAEAAEKK